MIREDARAHQDVDEKIKAFYAMKEGFKAIKFHEWEKAVRDIIFRFALRLHDEEYAINHDDKKYMSKQENIDSFTEVLGYCSLKYGSKMSLKDRRKYIDTITSIMGMEKVKKSFEFVRKYSNLLE